MQNIGGENAGDAFYRYKMPRLIGKIEGRGNGIKTNVVNNVDIAKALERPPECEFLVRRRRRRRRGGGARVWRGRGGRSALDPLARTAPCWKDRASSPPSRARAGVLSLPTRPEKATHPPPPPATRRRPAPPPTKKHPPPSQKTDILKFYGCELGAQTNFDKNTGTSIVNGAHDTKKLSELLESFIKKYVQCYSCGNPETTVKVKAKDEAIFLKCKACGHVSSVDMRHKLNTFILKNPPDNKLSKEEKRLKKAEEERMRDAKEGAKKSKSKSSKSKGGEDDEGEDGEGGDEGDSGGDKKEKKKDKKSSKKDKKLKKSASGKTQEDGGEEGEGEGEGGEGGGGDNGDGDDDDESEEVVWMTDTSAAAAAARAAEQLTAATAALVMQGNIEAEAAEERKRAKKEAKKEAQAAVARAEAGDKLDPAAAAAALRAAMSLADSDALPSCTAPPPDSKAAMAAAAKLLGGALSVEGGAAGKARALYEALFLTSAADGASAAAPADGGADGASPPPPATLAADIARFAPLLRAATRALGGAAGALAQLVALEHLLAVSLPEERLRKEGAAALKALHDEDVVEDEGLVVAWAERKDAGAALGVPSEGAEAVRGVVAPVVQWLKEAETSSEEGSDDDEEDEDDSEDDE
jgi:translation initiation factor 5